MSLSRIGKPKRWVNVTKEEYSERRKKEVAAGINPPPIANRGNKDFRHTDETKALIKQKVRAARLRVTEERGAYFSDEVILSIKTKLAERMTPERRAKFREDTTLAIERAHEVQQIKADDFARKYGKAITLMQNQGHGLVTIAARLTDAGFTSPRGCAWTDQTVRQVLKRLKKSQTRALSAEIFKDIPPGAKVVQTGNRQKIIRWDRIT